MSSPATHQQMTTKKKPKVSFTTDYITCWRNAQRKSPSSFLESSVQKLDYTTPDDQVTGTHCLGERIENAERFMDTCAQNNFVIGGSIFPHRKTHTGRHTEPVMYHQIMWRRARLTTSAQSVKLRWSLQDVSEERRKCSMRPFSCQAQTEEYMNGEYSKETIVHHQQVPSVTRTLRWRTDLHTQW